ncbi:DUF664 domain-containing protein [Streptomyces sp. NBC_00454]|uniref:mycothiol transferase n=1 Tax=Streptomyces sp. NBC_00454 TaxID=2975747 RepID=UPI00352FD446
MGGADVPRLWSETHGFQAAYDASGATRAQAFAGWEADVGRSRAVETAAEPLDVTAYVATRKEDASLRTLMLRVIHDYARQNGPADFLRDAVDGTTGT